MLPIVSTSHQPAKRQIYALNGSACERIDLIPSYVLFSKCMFSFPDWSNSWTLTYNFGNERTAILQSCVYLQVMNMVNGSVTSQLLKL